MPSSALDAKKKGRQTLHARLAVSAFYENDDIGPTEITVRWHNKLARNGTADDGFDISIVEGIDRLVFQQTNLALAGIDPAVMGRGDTVKIVYEGEPLAVFKLEHMEDPDGPENIYWAVSRISQ